MNKVTFFWHRRDLRLNDNAGLYHALKSSDNVQCLFIFDTDILDHLPKDDARVNFIHTALCTLNEELTKAGSNLIVKIGKPREVWQSLVDEFNVAGVYTNKDFEPYAVARDQSIKELLQSKNIGFKSYKDHVIFESDEVVKEDGKPYTVFTPYKNKWLKKLESKTQNGSSYFLRSFPSERFLHKINPGTTSSIPPLKELGFEPSALPIPSMQTSQSVIKDYDKNRDFPAIKGTSRLGIHFRFGTISIREKARKALALNKTFLSELIWRDFYAQILHHFPYVTDRAFRPEYDRIAWRYNEEELERWKNGMTGYPIVDAGMRELNATGFMHNRVRMITASFLTKHLLIDWRLGEAYFAEKLLDYDLASNNGGWQWSAGCGTDAAPYFRIFSPAAQEKKFDKDRIYIKRWVPEVDGPTYVKPVVDHTYARERCLLAYKTALK